MHYEKKGTAGAHARTVSGTRVDPGDYGLRVIWYDTVPEDE